MELPEINARGYICGKISEVFVTSPRALGTPPLPQSYLPSTISVSPELACRSRDGRGVGVRVPVGARFSLLHVVQTGSGAHPVSYPVGTGGPFHGGKAVRV
jgi:hypothetical protein